MTQPAELEGQPPPAPQGDDREGGERPAHHDRLAAAPAHRRAASCRSSCRRSAPVETKQLCYSVLTEEQKHRSSRRRTSSISSFGVKGLSRFRANIFMQRGAVAGAFRTIPFKILTFEELGLPPIVAELANEAERPRPRHRARRAPARRRRSRRSSTRSTPSSACHIITIEDPIEYLHPHKLSIVNQREVGTRHRERSRRRSSTSSGRTRTSCSSARCATSRRSRRRSRSARRATSSSPRSTRTAPSRRSTASSTSSRRTSRRRCARSCRSCSRAS